MKTLKRLFVDNWKTTAVGFGAAVVELMAGGLSLRTAATAAGLAAIGAVASDGDRAP